MIYREERETAREWAWRRVPSRLGDELIRACRNGYVLLPGGRKPKGDVHPGAKLLTAYSFYCQEIHRPLVYAFPRGNFYTVQLSVYTAEWPYRRGEECLAKEEMDRLATFFRERSSLAHVPRGEVWDSWLFPGALHVDPWHCWSRRIRKREVEDVAAALFQLAAEFGARRLLPRYLLEEPNEEGADRW